MLPVILYNKNAKNLYCNSNMKANGIDSVHTLITNCFLQTSYLAY